MALSVMERIKPFFPLLGWMFLAALSGTILIAVASHNDNEKSHPDMQQKVALLSQRVDSRQEANDKAHAQIIDLLGKLTVKVDAL